MEDNKKKSEVLLIGGGASGMGMALARGMSTNGTYPKDNDISDSCVLAYKTASLGFRPLSSQRKDKIICVAP